MSQASVRSDILTVLMPGFEGSMVPEWLRALLREGLGSVCLFGSNCVEESALKHLGRELSAARPGLLIAIDEEGGDVTRLSYHQGSDYPGAAVLGRLDELRLTAAVGAAVGWELRRYGINLNLAPDADVNSNPLNPVIGVRSFGADPEHVARHTAAWIEGLQSSGVAASAKHFPGHGDTTADSHLALPVVDRSLEALRERELVPFRAAIDAGCQTIMTSHILLPQLDAERPATLSAAILQGLLRDELGFSGVIVSDALDMAGASADIGIPEAAVRALAAGCDLLCIGPDNTGEQLEEIIGHIEAAVRSGGLSRTRLAEAASRVGELIARLAQFAEIHPAPSAAPALPVGASLAADAIDARRLPVTGPLHWVQLETVPSIAVGAVPWGPFAAGVEPLAVLTEQEHASELGELDGTLVLVGRDNHRHAWVRESIDRLRQRHRVITVDMGWPDATRHYADIASFGASRLMGRAVKTMLERAAKA